jgi:phage FluMu protein Com
MASMLREVMLTTSAEVRCPKCGAYIGSYMQVGNRVCLQIGTVSAITMHGRCRFCNTEYHWVESHKSLEILEKRKNRGI